VPLARRPRVILEFRSGGLAMVYQPSPDDRMAATSAQWSLEGNDLTITLSDGTSLRGTRDTPTRLTIFT
jgi:hypothetical protein